MNVKLLVSVMIAIAAGAVQAAELPALKFGVGLFQPDKDKNDATYRPLAQYLSQKLGRAVELRTVDTWEGLAKSLANGETDVALLGPWAMSLPITSRGHRRCRPSSTMASQNILALS